ncbi:hypothetical protein CUU95_18325 [Vreelandella alkaliphila]|nr:hypothetical protein CUU95_18325 [Halomonas alkaliphila]
MPAKPSPGLNKLCFRNIPLRNIIKTMMTTLTADHFFKAVIKIRTMAIAAEKCAALITPHV